MSLSGVERKSEILPFLTLKSQHHSSGTGGTDTLAKVCDFFLNLVICIICFRARGGIFTFS